MQVEITGRHIALTPALRHFTEERLSKLDRLLDGPLEAHVVLDVARHGHRAEIQISGPNLKLTGAEETDDLYTSIRETVDKLERQARKHKTRLLNQRHGRPSRATD